MIFLSFVDKRGKKYKVGSILGEDLLLRLDKFLKKNKIKFAEVKNWRLAFTKDQNESLTSKRIAQAVFKALKFIQDWE